MPKWIHDRAEHLLAKNPDMPKSMAFAISTQQAHSIGKSPKSYGTAEGRRVAKAKFSTPKDDKKIANPGNLDSPKLAEPSPLMRALLNNFDRDLADPGWRKREKTAEEHKLQGHINFQGIDIAVENQKGSVRSGTDKDGNKWRTVMKIPYGYLKGTKGADGEEVDVYVGPNKEAPNAYVVHQHKSDGKGFDEDKILIGMDSEEEARAMYLKHYDDPKFLGPISTVPIEKLKEMIAKGKPMKKISHLDVFFSEVEKLAATRAVKEWRAAQEAGNVAGANQIAQGYGQLGLSPRYLKDVSSGGSEGGVDLMMGRAGGAVPGAVPGVAGSSLQQRKQEIMMRRAPGPATTPAPNPSGLLARKLYKSDSPIATGANMGSLLAQKQKIVDTARSMSPEAKEMVPAMYGHRTIVGGGGQLRHVSEHEYVPNASHMRNSANPQAAVQRFQDVVAQPLAERGMPIADVPRVHGGGVGGNAGNVVMQGNTPKMVDFMPQHHQGPTGGLLTVQRGAHDLVATTAGSGLADSRFTPGSIGSKGTSVMNPGTKFRSASGAPMVHPNAEAHAMQALRKDVFKPSSMSHVPAIPPVAAPAAKAVKSFGSATRVAAPGLRSMVTNVARKLAFATSEYSGPMNPVILSHASQIPPFRVPSLKAPLEKKAVDAGWIAQKLHSAVEGMRAAGKSPQEMLARASKFDQHVAKGVKSPEGRMRVNLGVRLGRTIPKIREYNAKDLPNFHGPSEPVDVMAGHRRSITKEAVAGFSPGGHLAATKRVGTGFGRAAPGPSVAEIAKIPGAGKPLPNAVKDTI